MGYMMLTKPGCKYCTLAKKHLEEHNIHFTVSNYDTPEKIEKFKAAGYETFPQIFHDGVLIGGYDQLVEYMDF